MTRTTRRWLPGLVAALILADAALADDAPFRFESVTSLDAMTALIQKRFVPGTPRDVLRRAFADQGRATLKVNPIDPSVEKYLYDIDLCSYYVWRWNVSATFDAQDRLVQAYVNGEPVFADGPQKATPPNDPTGRRQGVTRRVRERPEAIKGEGTIAYTVLDPDIGSQQPHPLFASGAGPSKPNPVDLGTPHLYTNVDPWRSIFDSDEADAINPYGGNCRTVDATLKRMFTKPADK